MGLACVLKYLENAASKLESSDSQGMGYQMKKLLTMDLNYDFLQWVHSFSSVGLTNFSYLYSIFLFVVLRHQRGGVVIERLTPNREVLGSIPTGVTVLCPWARHFSFLQYWFNPGSVGPVPT